MHVLITNNTLEHSAGSERSVLDIAFELGRRGHRVSAFSCQLGPIASKLADAGVEVFAELTAMGDRPDLIHGHHHWETSLAALRWPETPLISFRRGIDPWQEVPCKAPWTAAWVGIDQPCLNHLIEIDGVPKEHTHLLLNGVRIDTFRPRSSLPERPARALVLSNYATEENFLSEIREACALEGIDCDAIGRGVGNPKEDIAQALANYDLVFAKGRAALESIVAGCALIVCDYGGLGEFVTTQNFDALRARSFFYDCGLKAVTVDRVRQRLAEWQPSDSLALTARVRETCSLDANIDSLEALYETALARARAPGPGEIAAFATGFLANKGLSYKLGHDIQNLYRQEKGTPPPAGPEEASKEWGRCINLYRKGRAHAAAAKPIAAAQLDV